MAESENLNFENNKEPEISNTNVKHLIEELPIFITETWRIFYKTEPSVDLKLEINIYSCYMLLRKINESQHSKYIELFYRKLFEFILDYIKKENISDKLPNKSDLFINNRLATYQKEISSLEAMEGVFPVNIIRNLYFKQLQPEATGERNFDALAYIKKASEYENHYESLLQGIYSLIKAIDKDK